MYIHNSFCKSVYILLSYITLIHHFVICTHFDELYYIGGNKTQTKASTNLTDSTALFLSGFQGFVIHLTFKHVIKEFLYERSSCSQRLFGNLFLSNPSISLTHGSSTTETDFIVNMVSAQCDHTNPGPTDCME